VIITRTSVVSAETLAFVVADALSGAMAMAFALGIGFGTIGSANGLLDIARLAAPVLLVPLAFGLCGLYRSRPSLASALRHGLVPLILCCAAVSLLVAATSSSRLNIGVAGTFLAVLLLTSLALRAVHGALTAKGRAAPRAIIVGTVDQAVQVSDLLQRQPRPEYRPCGLVYSRRHLDRPPESLAGLPVLGALESLESAVASTKADVILVGASASKVAPDLLYQLRKLRFQGVAILDFVTLHERLAREIPLGEVDEAWLFGAAMSCSRLHIRWLKRLLDLVLCAILLIPAALLFLPAALAIKLTSPGPVVFRQERLGLGGKTFWLLKLRTMRTDAEQRSGPVWSTENDPRITKIGRILRKFRLDELPQLLNVLRGDMSLVGPRPERPILARKICEKVPLFPERLMVRPGITGWAQVMAPYASSIEDSHRKLQFDLYYIKNLSFWLDLFILAKTASTVLFGREREQGGLVAGRQLEQPAPAARHAAASPELVALSDPSDEFPIPPATAEHSGTYQISRTA
jgi:exopolysaccharide biosynthesis polyprenyl glycosylphosphotransferase